MPDCWSSFADGRSAGFGGNRDEQMLGADVLVLQALGFGLRQVGDQLQSRGQPGSEPP